MPLSKQRWDEIETNLSRQFGAVTLKCDGYQVTAVVQSYQMRLHVMIYIDGEFQGKWLDGKDERCTKFYRYKKKYIFSAEKRRRAHVLAQKEKFDPETRAMFKRHTEAFIEQWVPYWTSPAAFCRHIRKTCTDIEFIR